MENENNFKETVSSLFKGNGWICICEDSGRRCDPCRETPLYFHWWMYPLV